MSDQQISKPINRLFLLGLIVPCLLISIPAVIAYRAQAQLTDSFHWVAHTIEVQQQLQRLHALLLDAESNQRMFLLTSHATYLEPYRAAAEQISHQTAELRALTADNSVQQENLRQLEPLVAAKLAFMAQTISLHQQGAHEAALKLVDTGDGKTAMDAIRVRLDQMEREESGLLVQRQEYLGARARFSTAFLLALVAVNLVFAAAAILMFRRLAQMRNLVTICAWSRTVEYEGQWLSFEAYLLRRFNLDTSHGISPAEAERVFGTAPAKAAPVEGRSAS